MFRDKEEILLTDDQWGRPTFAPDLAEAILRMLDASGLYHFGARFYDPGVGRWTQSDPLDQAGNLVQGNRYAYAGGDPVNMTDLSGRFSLPGQHLIGNLLHDVLDEAHDFTVDIFLGGRQPSRTWRRCVSLCLSQNHTPLAYLSRGVLTWCGAAFGFQGALNPRMWTICVYAGTEETGAGIACGMGCYGVQVTNDLEHQIDNLLNFGRDW